MSEDASPDTVVSQMRADGLGWDEIAAELDISVDTAMDRWRAENWDYWQPGWSFEPSDGGLGTFVSGPITVYSDSHADAQVSIEEISNGSIPVSVSIDGEECDISGMANMDAEQARDLADALNECADILEGMK